jgi:hypothetical protein
MENLIGYILIILGSGAIIGSIIMRRKQQKVVEYVKKIKAAAKAASQQVAELHLRDKQGKFFMVKIVIDTDIDDEETSVESSDVSGRLIDVMKGQAVDPEVGNCREFHFSAAAVSEMREAGIEPDMIVTKMLRAAGKIT